MVVYGLVLVVYTLFRVVSSVVVVVQCGFAGVIFLCSLHTLWLQSLCGCLLFFFLPSCGFLVLQSLCIHFLSYLVVYSLVVVVW